MLVVTCSEAGEGHANEDVFLVEEHPQDASCLLAVVADGQGGRSGGRQAAETACRSFMDQATPLTPKELLQPQRWPGLLRAVDDAVRQNPDAGFTTLVAICIWQDRIVGGSCGDSAALVINGPTTFEWLTSRQQKNPPVGSGAAVFWPFQATLKTPWQVLLMTDGVWKYAGQEAIVQAALQHRGDELIDQAKSQARLPRSGHFPDDFTLVVIASSDC